MKVGAVEGARRVGQVKDVGGQDNIEDARGYDEVRKGGESNETEGRGGGAQVSEPEAGE